MKTTLLPLLACAAFLTSCMSPVSPPVTTEPPDPGALPACLDSAARSPDIPNFRSNLSRATDAPCTPVEAPGSGMKNLGVLYAWMLPNDRWRQEVVTVNFQNGNDWQISETWKCFKEWQKDLDDKIQFQCVAASDNPDIRVRFGPGGHWSYLGRGNLSIPQGEQTMNLEFGARETQGEIQRVARHEIGHALGLQHEHQSPLGGLVWNEPAVYKYYRTTQGWSDEQIRQQVLNKYKGSNFRGTEVDPSSIMMYPIPKGLANIEVGWNWKIDAVDVWFIRDMYGVEPNPYPAP